MHQIIIKKTGDAHPSRVPAGYHLVWPFVHVQHGNSFPTASVRLLERHILWPLFSEAEDGGRSRDICVYITVQPTNKKVKILSLQE